MIDFRNRRTLFVITVSTLVVSIVAILFLLIIPTVKEVRAMRTALLEEQRTLEMRYQQGLLLKRLRDDWEKIQNDVPLLDTAVLDIRTSISFITRLETLAATVGVTHALTLPLSEKTEKGTTAVPFTLRWQGDWRSLLRMLTALEQEPYYLPMEHITIVANRESTPPQNAFIRTAPSSPRTPKDTTNLLNADMQLSGTTLWRNE